MFGLVAARPRPLEALSSRYFVGFCFAVRKRGIGALCTALVFFVYGRGLEGRMR